jgi:hypothetical protein
VTAPSDFGRLYIRSGHKVPKFPEGSTARHITLATFDLTHTRKGVPQRLASLLERSWNRTKGGFLDYPLPGKRFTGGEYRSALNYLHSSEKCAGGVLISHT